MTSKEDIEREGELFLQYLEACNEYVGYCEHIREHPYMVMSPTVRQQQLLLYEKFRDSFRRFVEFSCENIRRATEMN